jgi:hypothetical protein
MVSLGIVFLVLALVFFIVAAAGIPFGPVNTTAVGLVFLTLWFLVPAFGGR